MSKRLIRINTKNAFSKLESGAEINAVLQNGHTYFGIIESVTADELVLLDTRDHRHQILFSDLYEIVCDQETVVTLPSS